MKRFALLCALAAAAARGQVAPLQIDHDVTVASMVSDRFTWRDSANRPRVAVLAHNDNGAGPGGAAGGALREFRYQLPNGDTRVATVTTYGNAGYAGFGYVVSHSSRYAGCVGDDSPLGGFIGGHWSRVFEGRHHAIFRFTQNYPRNCPTTTPVQSYTIPVTIDWIFSTGRDHPVWAITYDVDLAAPANTFYDDSRAPYGELNIDGDGTTDIDGTAWGDRYRFTSTTSPISLSSSWTWNVANTVPYVKEWLAAPLGAGDTKDATMGLVQTQTMTQQDAGGARDPDVGSDITPLWKTTSSTCPGCPNVCAAGQPMPCPDNWPYQANGDSLFGGANNNARLTWKTQYGFLGQTSYDVHDGVVATASGYPKKSYSLYIILGTHSSSPVEAQRTQVETMQSVTLTASVGTVVTSGPAGVTRADNVSYAPAGYNHVYGALAFTAAGNALDANVAVGSGTLTKPLIIVGSYSGGNPQVKFAGVTLTADVDYFASLRSSPNELWITLNRDLSGGTNHLQITGTPVSRPVIGDISGDRRADIFWRNMQASQESVWLMNGTAPSFAVLSPNAPSPWTPVAFGDFDADGKADVFWQNPSTGETSIWLGWNGSNFTTFVRSASVATSWQARSGGDIDGDGKSDLFWFNASTGESGIWFMNGTSIASAVATTTVPASWAPMVFGDFDGDGKSDVFWRNASTGETAIWLGWNGTSFATQVRSLTIPTAWVPVGAADIDGDGKSDIFWYNTSTGETSIWFMNGTTFSSAVRSTTVGPPWQPVWFGDFAGSGKSGIFWRNSATGETSFWLDWNGSSWGTQVRSLTVPLQWAPAQSP